MANKLNVYNNSLRGKKSKRSSTTEKEQSNTKTASFAKLTPIERKFIKIQTPESNKDFNSASWLRKDSENSKIYIPVNDGWEQLD